MKELSIEEKAKAYDEAIKKAESLYKASEPMSGCNVIIETLFPELKESEDERMRKELIRAFNSLNTIKVWNGIERTDILAWLEKQRNKDEEILVLKDQIESLHAAIKAIKNLHKIKLEKQGEQKSKKVSLWKHWKNGIAGNGEGKQIYLVKVGNTYKLTSCLGFECDYIELSELDKLLSEKQGEQKPAWSEEDVEIIEALISLCDVAKDNIPQLSALKNWLKSLKDRFQPQPKRNWSEEDEDAIGMAIIALEDMYDEDAPNTTYGGYNLPFNKAAERLKSLNPQSRWKPNDEQMLAINTAINVLGKGTLNGRQLIKLREELQKLREE